MQKIVKSVEFCLFFLPFALFLWRWNSYTAFATGLFYPQNAISYFANGVKKGESEVPANPFKDFSLSDFKDVFKKEIPASANVDEDLSPNYNVAEEFFPSYENSLIFKKDNCYIKNVTYFSDEETAAVALSPVSFRVNKNSDQPQILIYHTHATESYLPTASQPFDPEYSFRSTDTDKNMVAVGRVMCEELNRLGYNAVQDTTLHDYPSYNGSYDKSKATIQKYLDKYPSIKVVIDVHRDAAERDGTIISPVVEINGEKCAQIMIISGADNGKMNMPNFWENLKFSSAVQNTASDMYPGLMRPLLFDYRNYNQQMSTGAFLVEIGTHGASLVQAKRSAKLFANALARAFDEMNT